MKKHKISTCALIATLALSVSGCGTPIHEMTQSEEDLIVHYAAYVVAKHNIYQSDGMTTVILEEDEEEFNEESSQNGTVTDTQQNNTENANGGENAQPTEPDSIFMADAIGQTGNLGIAYMGSSLENHYTEQGYSVDAEAGKKYYVMKFQMKNISARNVTVDNVSLNPEFRLSSEGKTIKAEMTFLNSDFSTYTGTLAPGEIVDTILLFEVSEKEKISSPELNVTVNGKTEKVKL